MPDGSPFDPRQQAELAAIAENTSTAGGVEKWHACIDARSGMVICDAGTSGAIA